MADQQFCLRWNNHQSTLISVFDTLLENGTLVDCTLAAEGQYLKAHKVVLSACSPYLETLLSQHCEKHPIVILKDVKFSELKSMMDYMYRGEVNISQDQLGTFLKAAESLQIKGLSDNGADGDARDVGSTPKAPPPRKATQPAPSSRPEPARPDSPLTDGSMSPSSRKRRRVRRSSQDDGDSHLDSNSCDLPSQAQSTPVPNIPAATSSITTTPIVKPAIVKPETDVNRIDSNSLPPEALKKEIEPISEPLLEPKTEYLEDVNNEDSVEDLTLDDDDDMEGMDISNMSNMSNMSRPGPSHGNDLSNQSFAPWQLGANQSGTDEVFMAAQEAVNQHRDSQDKFHHSLSVVVEASEHNTTHTLCEKKKEKIGGKQTYTEAQKDKLSVSPYIFRKNRVYPRKTLSPLKKSKPTQVKCPDCDTMLYPNSLLVHRSYFCNKEPPKNLEFKITGSTVALCLKCKRTQNQESIILHSKYTCKYYAVTCLYCPAVFRGQMKNRRCSLLNHIKAVHYKGMYEVNYLISKLRPEDFHVDDYGVASISYQSAEEIPVNLADVESVFVKEEEGLSEDSNLPYVDLQTSFHVEKTFSMQKTDPLLPLKWEVKESTLNNFL